MALPLLGACGGNQVGGSVMVPPGGLTLPDCTEGQLISVGTDRTLGCTQALTTSLSPPSCPSGYALNANGGALVCVAKGTGTTNADLTAAINNVITKTQNLQTQIASFGSGSGNAQYCGSTSTTTVGRITANAGALVGLAAASNLCGQVAGCGAGAHMCTVYEMFESVASGVVKQTDQIAKAWVYMASWQNFSTGAVEPTAGLNDNCGSYTYPTGDRQWQGTAVKWENDNAGDRTLKFYTGVNRTGIGNPVGNYEGAPCNVALPIACCK